MRAAVVLLLAALAACASPAGGAVHEESLGGAVADPANESLEPADESFRPADESLEPSAEPAPAVDLPAGDEIVLDQRADGATLRGAPERAIAEADPERVLILRAELGGRSLDPALDGARVLDARFAAEAIVVLGADHVLRAHRSNGVLVLDEAVEAPLSVEGNVVAYARGEMPLFELARADVETGVAHALTEGMSPVWSPALSPDGREIVFVSGATGAPRLYRLGENGTAALLPDVGAFPSSLRAPRWTTSGVLRFETETGEARELDLSTAELSP